MTKSTRRTSLGTKRPSGTTRQPSVYPSTHPSEDGVPETEFTPFRFLELPSELRNKIYGFVFNNAPLVIDLDPENSKTIHRYMSLFLVSKQINGEATHHFFSTHTIRLFPVHPGRFFKTSKPLLSRLRPRFRASINSLELKLGPGWQNPPRGWVVNDALGLKDAENVRVLKVMVQVDTSDSMFDGFRRADGFYEEFCKGLLDNVLRSVPSIIEVQYDAYPSIRKDGVMMRGLLEVAKAHKKLISWGPESGCNEEMEANLTRDVLSVEPVALERLADVAVLA